MGTDVVVVIAYRHMGVEERYRSFCYVHAWYSSRGFTVVVEGGDDDTTFTRASAINAAIRHTTADVIVQSDPDSLVPETQLREAIALAGQADGLVIPHDRYLYLTPEATARVLDDGVGVFDIGVGGAETDGTMGSGNVVVFSRNTWQQAGGFDERFGLHGGDDTCFAMAAAAFTNPTRRLPGHMVHLWHPRLPQSEPGHPLYVDQFAIVGAYRDAAEQGPGAVQDLVASRDV